jgi:hypothetical protein
MFRPAPSWGLDALQEIEADCSVMGGGRPLLGGTLWQWFWRMAAKKKPRNFRGTCLAWPRLRGLLSTQQSVVLNDDAREFRRVVFGLEGELGGGLAGDLSVDLADARVWLGHDRRLAAVSLHADGNVERQ